MIINANDSQIKGGIMKKILLLIAVLTFSLIGCENSTEIAETQETETVETSVENNDDENDSEALTIYTSNYPLYDFTSKIVGDKANVINITENSGFHGWEPTARDIANLQSADLFIYNGEGLENWADSLIENGTITSEILEASNGIELLESTHSHDHDHEDEVADDHDHNHEHEDEVADDHDHDHDHEEDAAHNHEHGEYDPHIWLSLRNAVKISENIKNKLSELDPENASIYEENYNNFKSELESLDEEYTQKFENKKNDTIIVSHEAYGYLAHDYNFNQVGIESINAEGEPSVQQIDEIIKTARDLGTNVIFYEHTISPKVSEMIASEIDAELIQLNPLEALSQEEESNNDDYLSVMRKNLEGLEKALNE